MKPKDNLKTNFLYSKPLRAKKLDLFYHSSISVDENLDICDQISSILDDRCTGQKADSEMYEQMSYVQDDANTTLNTEMNPDTENTLASVLYDYNRSRTADETEIRCNATPERANDRKIRDDSIVHIQAAEAARESEASRSSNVQKFSYKLPVFKNLFQPPYSITKPNFFGRSSDQREDPGASDLDNEDLHKKILHNLPSIVQKLCDENTSFKSLTQNQEDSIQKLEAKKDALNAKIHESEVEKDNIICELKKLNSDYNKLSEEMEQNNAYKKEIESYLAILREELEGMKLKQSEVNEVNKRLMDEKGALATKIARQEKDAVALTEKNCEMESTVRALQEQTEGLELERALLVSTLEASNKTLCEVVAEYDARVNSLTHDLGTLTQDLAAKSCAIEDLLRDKHELRQANDVLGERIREHEEYKHNSDARLEEHAVMDARLRALFLGCCNKAGLVRTCFDDLRRDIEQHEYRRKAEVVEEKLVREKMHQAAQLVDAFKEKLFLRIVPEFKDVQRCARHLKKSMQKSKEREALKKVQIEKECGEELQRLKIQYSLKIRKIYKYYKEKEKKMKAVEAEPADEDVWNVFK